MKINDSTYSNSILASTQGVGKANKQVTIKPVVSVVDENNQANQSKNLNKEKSRFEVNQKAIELLEQQGGFDSALSGSVLVEREPKNTSSNRQSQTSQYDQPSQQNLSAVAAYESVDSIAQKENIKQVFGVSLFA